MARPSHSDHVLQQLNNQREWGFLCDCLIAIGDIYFRAHKAVLAACSSYFRMQFIREQQGAPPAQGRMDLSNMQISAECFDLILQLMYLGRIVVGSYEFDQLKTSMAHLQMYYIPDSLEDLRDLRSSNLTPSSSASSSSSVGPAAGKMMFGVRMYEQQKPAAPEADVLPKAVSSSLGRPTEDQPLNTPTHNEVSGEQPCDLRKRPMGRGSLKERPRFGRTYTCDDCGFVFSCEKLLIEHILTCTNRKAFNPPRSHTDAESSTSDSLDHEEQSRLVCKAEEDCDTHSVSIKTEPEENLFPEIEMVRVGEHAADCSPRAPEAEARPGASRTDTHPEPMEALSSTSQEGKEAAAVKQEVEEGDSSSCELCGALLSDADPSAHYLAHHMGHICACGRCGQVLIKGRQLQEHAQRCGEESGEDEPQDMDEALACSHCGQLCASESLALEHSLTCHDTDPFQPAAADPWKTDPPTADHRRKHFCSICGKGFFQRCHLREHYTVHTKEKQFTCLTCGKQFLRERQLRLHTDMHKGMARYVCPVCDQGTFLKHDHVRHMITHLSPGQTICQVCFQVFPNGEELEKHMDVHLYICGVCGEKFRLRKDMRSHYNSKHTKRL